MSWWKAQLCYAGGYITAALAAWISSRYLTDGVAVAIGLAAGFPVWFALAAVLDRD